MARERVEDLGRIAVMIDSLMEHEIWEVYMGRKKDFEEFFHNLDEEKQDNLLRSIIYGLETICEKLCEINSIAEGTDRLNESP